MFIIAKSVENLGIHYVLREREVNDSESEGKVYTLEVCDGIFEENPKKNMHRNDCEIKSTWSNYDKAMQEFLKTVS